MIDSAKSVRTGEELDIPQLSTYLKNEVGLDPSGLEVKQFPGGFSNLTYLLTIGEQEYVLRRPPFGAKIKTAHDMGREFRVLSLLKPLYGKVPSPLSYCEDESVLGAPFYIMERVKGVILRNKAPKGVDLTPELFQALSAATIDNLANLHNIDIEATGLVQMGKPEGYVERQVKGWSKRYFKSQTDEIPSMDATAAWMEENMPADGAPSFIHNDYKYDNLVLNPADLTDILAVLDWEMATVGDPLMDLGTTLGYWTEAGDSQALKPFGLTWHPGNMTRQEVVERYFTQRGLPVQDMLFYFVFGTFKIGVIAQQIYKRFKAGLTKDPRFGALIYVVQAAGATAQQAIHSGQISNF